MLGGKKKKEKKSIVQEFSILIFFFLLLLLEAKRESLRLLLRTGRWIRCWWLINSGILSLQIRPEVPALFSACWNKARKCTWLCVRVCVSMCAWREGGGCRAVGGPPKTLSMCSFSPDRHSRTATPGRAEAAQGQGANAGNLDGAAHPARRWPGLKAWSPWPCGSELSRKAAGRGCQEPSDTLRLNWGGCVWKWEAHAHAGSLSWSPSKSAETHFSLQ